MSTAARSLGLDIGEILAAAATKPYGFMRFLPGPGVGGHCIPCDPHYLLWQMHTHRLTLPLVTQAMTSIERRPLEVVARIAEVLAADGKVLAGAEIVVCGVAYKPDVEDVRESPALVIIEELRTAGADVSYVDPYVPEIRLRDGETIRASAPTGGSSPDLVLLHTSHTGTDLGWLAPDVLVLDATYQAVSARTRQVIL
jgi:nucleotide sugar dehydrogenase